MNKTHLLESVVITKYPEGYSATARFKDSKYDFIISSNDKEQLHKHIYFKVMRER